jgi:hypothetical protein
MAGWMLLLDSLNPTAMSPALSMPMLTIHSEVLPLVIVPF